MRRQRAPAGLTLAILLIFAANLKSFSTQNQQIDYSATQEHLVCKKPDSQLCVTWHLGPVDPDIIIEESPSNATQFCGLSDLKRILPHRKFITVKSLARDGNSKAVFCKGFTKLKGNIVNWNQVEKTLNALSRTRRQTSFVPRGRYRGQTQSQYLAIDRGNGKDEGKAEAHSAADSSRASVSGNSGMGQAQSQSIYDPNCDDCYGKSDQEAESLKRGPYVPGTSGNRYAPADNYGTIGSYKPGQGNAQQPITGYGPGRNGAFGPGPAPGSGTVGTGGYGPNGQNAGTGTYAPGQGSRPGPGYGSITIPGGNQGTNGGYGPGSGFGPSVTTPGDNQRANGGFMPGGGNGPGTVYGTPTGTTTGINQGPNGGFVPSQVNGQSTGYGTPIGPISGTNQGTNGGFVPGQGNGQGPRYGTTSGTTTGINQGPNGGYGPGPGSGTGSGYGPSAITTPGINQGANGVYGPGQGSGTGYRTPSSGNQRGSYGPDQGNGQGNVGYGPTLGIPPGGGQGSNDGTRVPSGQQGVNGFYGPEQGKTTPGTSGYGPSQFGGQNTGYVPIQNSGTYGNTPGQNGQGVTPGANQGLNIGQIRTPDGNIYTPTQDRQHGTQQSYLPGQTNAPGGTYGPSQNSYLPLQGPFSTTGYRPVQGSLPGNNAAGGNIGLGQPNGPSTGGTNWPLAMGPYPGPGGTIVYCCAVPNNFGQNIGTVGPSTGTGYPYGTEQRGTGGNGGKSEIQGPYGNKPSDIPSNLYGPGITGPTNVQGHQRPNNLQNTGSYGKGLITGPYGIGNINNPSNPQNIGKTDTYGTDSSLRPGSQNGNFGTGPSSPNILGQVNYVPSTLGGTGVQNGMQTPGYNTGTGESGGHHSLQEPGSYNTGNYGDQTKQYDLRQPGVSGGIETQNGMPVSGGNSYQPGGQNGMQGIGNYGTGPAIGSGGQNGMQGPGSFGSVPVSGLGNQNGPGISGTNIPGTSGGPNIMQTPRNYGTFSAPNHTGNQGSGTFGNGSPGGLGIQDGLGGTGNYGIPTGPEGQNGFQRPGSYGSGNGGPGGQNINQGPGIYGTGSHGTPGIQNGLHGPGPYGTSVGTVGQNGLQRPGIDGSGISMGPNSQNGLPGVDNNGQNLPSSQGGGNTGIIGGPGAYGGPNGNSMSGSGPPGYPGVYGQQGSLGQGSSSPHGFDNQGNPLQGNEYNGIPQNYVNPDSTKIDDDDSEAEAIVNQAANGTTASASSKGGNDKGRAQTHVHGTYTGGGSFQAQAQITGENKEAQSEVSGGKKGASSSATGSGRNNKSQASVQLGSETGSIQTNSQSNGAMHSSNSQVQGSVKGGMADAQAKGPGSTSSQAQIGFTPYKDGDKIHESFITPFVGGGVASAQSSGRTGQSQSQLHGTFKYGITYSGAAQSGASVDKDAIFPNRLNYEKIDVFDESQKNINVNSDVPENQTPSTESTLLAEVPIETKRNTSNEDEVTTEKPSDETMKNSESRYLSHTHLDHHKFDTTPIPSTAPGSRRSFQTGYENVGPDYEYTTDKDEIPPEEYDTDPGYGVEGNDATDVDQGEGEEFPNYDEYSRDYQTHQSLQSPQRKGIEVQQSTGGNTQHIVLGSLNNHDAEITQKNSERPDESKVYLPGERVPGTGGYRIPTGFTGSVKSVASKEKTYVVGSKHSPSQAQTVTLTPGTGKVNYVYPPSYGKYVKPKDLRSLQPDTPKDDRYVSVSKSVTRALDGEDNIRKQYSHTYYTKSSSCGYFTFTCTMVSGVDGRKKVCKPKIPTNPDGTPIRC